MPEKNTGAVAAKDGEESILSFPDVLSQPTILIKVGEEGKEYRIHKPLLTSYSGYFRGALGSSNFKEAAEGVVTLADVEVSAFDGFARQLYGKALHAPRKRKYHDYNDDVSRIIKAYALADRLLAPAYKEVLIDAAYDSLSSEFPSHEDVAWAFDTLPANDKFLTLLVDAYCKKTSPNSDKKMRKAAMAVFPKEFLFRVMERMQETCVKTPGLRRREVYMGKLDQSYAGE
ncbi:hypothetical protein K491DRAFT_753396 [Lophiostoma macrostomum CBS 122681]|uniref:BTB domain-containing protein n=1 Tax=Lophiostoma macrostomum CBS 122681 TaxID=1314788 RepID=A0A6A6TTK1_9PLEO|nr:hypothetical protein K491DRAFT_753396 [Lophiostoma macrostomum CBS 122681]